MRKCANTCISPYEEAVSHIWLCNCSIQNFLKYEKFDFLHQCACFFCFRTDTCPKVWSFVFSLLMASSLSFLNFCLLPIKIKVKGFKYASACFDTRLRELVAVVIKFSFAFYWRCQLLINLRSVSFVGVVCSLIYVRFKTIYNFV
jgi:hypothetical protein